MGACSSKKPETPVQTPLPALTDSAAVASRSLPSASECMSERRFSPSTISSPQLSLRSQTAEKFTSGKKTNEMSEKNGCPPKKPTLMSSSSQALFRSQIGGQIGRLIDANPPPQGWNEKLIHSYPVQCRELKTDSNQPMYQIIVHVSDDVASTKRQFLAFYKLQVHKMNPPDFVDWCRRNEMYNTMADYITLYNESRYHGLGSIYLRGLVRDRRALKIEMTDRFHTPKGVFRAIVFQASTLRGVYHLVNSYLQRMKPTDYRRVRCSLPDPLQVTDAP